MMFFDDETRKMMLEIGSKGKEIFEAVKRQRMEKAKITWKNPTTGEFETIEQTEEKAAESRAKFMNDAYEEGNLFFCMMDLGENGGVISKVNANPKFRRED